MILGECVCITVDHRVGSVDENGVYYPINVGYIENSLCETGRQKVYLLGVIDPVSSYNAEYIALLCSRGDEDRVICAPFGMEFSNDQILQDVSFAEKYVTVVRPINI